jgi:hypothetical protein
VPEYGSAGSPSSRSDRRPAAGSHGSATGNFASVAVAGKVVTRLTHACIYILVGGRGPNSFEVIVRIKNRSLCRAGGKKKEGKQS